MKHIKCQHQKYRYGFSSDIRQHNQDTQCYFYYYKCQCAHLNIEYNHNKYIDFLIQDKHINTSNEKWPRF